MNTLIGKKVQQTQGFLENGTRIPVTVVAASGNVIMGFKTQEKDSYSAVQMGFGKTKKPTKALLGIAKKANLTEVPSVIREVRVDDTNALELGKTVNVDEVFKPGDIVNVTGTSKGKGFAGGVKRYNFRGGPKTHGQSDRHRAPGSIGSGTTPGRVYKGKRMAGNMGNDVVTVENLLIIDVDSAKNVLYLKGLVPGILGGVISITKVGEMKEKNFVPLFKVAEPEPETQEEQAEAPVEEVAQETKTSDEVVPEQEAPAESSEVESPEEAVEKEEK